MSGITGPTGANRGTEAYTPLVSGDAAIRKSSPRSDGSGDVPPVGDDALPAASDRPTLAMPQPTTDSTDLLIAALAVKIKNGDQQIKSSTEEVQFNGAVQKSKNDDISRKLEEQIKKMEENKVLNAFLKAFQWIGIALAVIVAAVTMNPVAIAGAVTAVAMAVLNETGVMDKMTEAIASSLQKNGMSETDAKKWAMGITMGLTIAVSIATLGAGAASSTTNVGAKAVELAAKISSKLGDMVSKAVDVVSQIASQVTTAAKVSQATVGIAQASTAIGKGVNDHQIAQTQADVAELKAFLAKIKAAMDDEVDRIQAMLQQSQDVVSRAMKALSGVSETNSNIIRHMA